MKKKNLVFVGGGGHALSLIEALPDLKSVKGYLGLSPTPSMPVEWLGDDSMAPILVGDARFHIAFVYAGLPVMDKRRNIIDKFENLGADFETIVAQTAIVTRNALIGEGCAILNNAVINRAKLGRHVVVNTGAIVEHDCEIGSNSFIGPGVVTGGAVSIGSDCFIGLGARIKNGVRIASHVSVGMGAIVTSDLLQPGIYHGNPLKFHPLKK